MAMCSRCGNEFQTQGPPPPAGASLICPRCAAVASTVGSSQGAGRSTGGGTNGLGIAGFVCALVGIFTGIFLIPGLILSLIALRKPPRGLAIAGTVVSVVGIAFFGLLLAILLPSLARAKVLANRALIGVSEMAVVQGCVLYGQDHNAVLPQDMADLVASGGIVPENLIVPFAGETPLVIPPARSHDVAWIRHHLPGHCDLVYVGENTTVNDAASDIVVYSRPAENLLGKGLEIGFADATTHWVPMDQLGQVFAAANAVRKKQGFPLLKVPTLQKQ